MQTTNLFGNQLVNQTRPFGTNPTSVGFQGNQGSTFQQMGFSQSQAQPTILGFSTGLQSGLGGMGGGINNMQGQQFLGGISAGIQQPGMQVAMGSGLQGGQIQNSLLGLPILNQGMQQNIVSSQGLIQNQMGQRISQGFLTQPQSTGFLNQPTGTGFLNQPGNTGLLNQPLSSGFLNQPSNTGFLSQSVSAGLLNQPASSGFLNQSSNQGFLNQGISQGMGFGLNQGLNQGNLLGNNQMTNFQNQNQFLTSMPLSTSLGIQRPLTTQMTQQPGLLQQNNNMLATFGQDNFRKSLTQSPIQVNQKEGTSWLKFNITRDRDGQNISSFANFMTITAMDQYGQKSLEELRLEDFRLKRQGINGMQQQGINQFNGMQNMQGGLTGLQQNSLLNQGIQNNTPGTQMGISTGIPNNQLFAQNNQLSFSQGQVATSGSLFSQSQQANNQN